MAKKTTKKKTRKKVVSKVKKNQPPVSKKTVSKTTTKNNKLNNSKKIPVKKEVNKIAGNSQPETELTRIKIKLKKVINKTVEKLKNLLNYLKSNQVNKLEVVVILLMLGLITVIVVGLSSFMMIASPKKDSKKVNKLEKLVKEMVVEYYERDLKGKEYTMNRQKVSLKTLKNAGFDISPVKNPYNDKACREDSYAMIYIDSTSEIEVVNYLVCDNYITNHK